jgi:predicted nucleotidyltransferase
VSLLSERRARASERLGALRSELDAVADRARGRACVYVTGSYGRGEASEHSDLDLFVVSLVEPNDATWSVASAEVRRELDRARTECRFPSSAGTADFALEHHVDRLVGALGQPQDDAENTFTARLLLLLESRPLIEEVVYRDVIDRVLRAYWRDFEDHAGAFVPGFLANDVLRLWRTFCVNYEARTQSEPAERKAKRNLKNYKLKHSRLLTCYSALAYMLLVFGQRRTVTLEAARDMVALSPTERIEEIERRSASAARGARRIVSLYERFLSVTASPEADLITLFMDRSERARLMREASELGDAMYELMRDLGDESKLHRLLVV